MKAVYRFTKYDISKDEVIESHRWATREAIMRVGGTVLEKTEIHVDEALLDKEIPGMTVRNFNPSASKGFQSQVS